MGWQVFEFGQLYLDDKPRELRSGPNWKERYIVYDGEATMTFGDSCGEQSITWIKPDNLPLFVAEQVLLVSISWTDLQKHGFVDGKKVIIDGRTYLCRLPQVGAREGDYSEWDKIIDATSRSNALWDWQSMYMWGTEARVAAEDLSYRPCRGYYNAGHFGTNRASAATMFHGFRPILEPLDNGVAAIGKTVFLDGQEFLLSQLQESNEDIFYPQLCPMECNLFQGIPDGSIVKMYTLLCDGAPVNQNPTKQDVFHRYNGELALTDKFYGDDFLIPWTISHGKAVAATAAFHEINSAELRRQGFL